MKYVLGLASFLIITSSIYAAGTDGILVFTQKGCSRCEFAINYLKEHKIKYTEYPTEIESNNSKMWSLIEESGNPEVDRLTMPVIVNNGEVFFSIENLENLLEKLSEN
jgi:glutaredoxin